jgi:hypothetical protein
MMNRYLDNTEVRAGGNHKLPGSASLHMPASLCRLLLLGAYRVVLHLLLVVWCSTEALAHCTKLGATDEALLTDRRRSSRTCLIIWPMPITPRKYCCSYVTMPHNMQTA